MSDQNQNPSPERDTEKLVKALRECCNLAAAGMSRRAMEVASTALAEFPDAPREKTDA